MKWLRDNLNGTVSSSLRSGRNGGSPSRATGPRPTTNGRSPSLSEAGNWRCNHGFLAARYALLTDATAVWLRASLQVQWARPFRLSSLTMRSSTSRSRWRRPTATTTIVILCNVDFLMTAFSVPDDSTNVATRSVSAESSDVGSGCIHVFLPLALGAVIWRAPVLRDCGPNAPQQGSTGIRGC